MLNITVGKVPGNVKTITVEDGSSALDAMKIASIECGFTFSETPYLLNGKEMIDVPSINSKELCERGADGRSTRVIWDTPLRDGDILLITPAIKGN